MQRSLFSAPLTPDQPNTAANTQPQTPSRAEPQQEPIALATATATEAMVSSPGEHSSIPANYAGGTLACPPHFRYTLLSNPKHWNSKPRQQTTSRTGRGHGSGLNDIYTKYAAWQRATANECPTQPASCTTQNKPFIHLLVDTPTSQCTRLASRPANTEVEGGMVHRQTPTAPSSSSDAPQHASQTTQQRANTAATALASIARQQMANDGQCH